MNSGTWLARVNDAGPIINLIGIIIGIRIPNATNIAVKASDFVCLFFIVVYLLCAIIINKNITSVKTLVMFLFFIP
ncbi:Uncharacterised protein [Chlamydia trachomatis]|nr:Uncharacterised protein [Chlamydia trachomatis]